LEWPHGDGPHGNRLNGDGTMEKIPFTPQGLDAIKEELAHLKANERPAVIQAIADAREHGDLSENAEYHAARERQSFVEGRISELEDVTSRAEVIDAAKLSGEKVTFGTTVEVADEDTDEESTYHIVGPYEADITKGLVSTSSPIARGLIGKAVGDSAEVHTPGGVKSYEVLSIALFDMGKVAE
jgi:transcription elongation factor GreA